MNNLGHHIKRLSGNSNLQSDYNPNDISNLSKVNIFVGSNNSGKSRFLRGIFAINKSLSFIPPEEMVDVEKYYNILRDFMDAIISTITESSLEGIGNLEVNQLISEIKDLEHIPFLKEDEDLFKHFHRLFDEISKLNSSSSVTSKQSMAGAAANARDHVIANLKALLNDYQSKIDEITPSSRTSYKINFKRVYIPTLRALEDM